MLLLKKKVCAKKHPSSSFFPNLILLRIQAEGKAMGKEHPS